MKPTITHPETTTYIPKQKRVYLQLDIYVINSKRHGATPERRRDRQKMRDELMDYEIRYGDVLNLAEESVRQ